MSGFQPIKHSSKRKQTSESRLGENERSVQTVEIADPDAIINFIGHTETTILADNRSNISDHDTDLN